MNYWKVIVVAVALFFAGATTGGLLIKQVQPAHPRSLWRAAAAVHPPAARPSPLAGSPAPSRPPEFFSRRFLQSLDESLRLSPEQRVAVQKIIAEGQDQMRKTVQDARLEIRESLTPRQRLAFDGLVQRHFRQPLFQTNAPSVPADRPQ